MGYSTFSEKVGKWGDLRSLARYRDEVLRVTPRLRHLFFEVTSDCNEYCRHCGSRCGDYCAENPLTDLMAGKITLHVYLTPPSPAQEIDFVLEYDASYVESALSA